MSMVDLNNKTILVTGAAGFPQVCASLLYTVLLAVPTWPTLASPTSW